MIYFISDIHGGESVSGLEKYISVCNEKDLLIILGDLGINFEKTNENRRFTRYFESLKVNIAFIDGNHENFEYINSFPEDNCYGGKVQRISETIVHLKRGNVYEIDGFSFFVMGGCKSSSKWKEMSLWYPGEEPGADEIAFAYENLKKYNNKVDYILTHKYSAEYDETSGEAFGKLMKYIDEKVKFRHWYSGHWHQNLQIDDLHTVVYDEPVKLK